MNIFQKRIIITFSSLLIALVALLIFIILPSLSEIKHINQEVDLQRQELEEKFLAGQNLRKTLADLAKIQANLPQLYAIFIEENKELDFITTLEKIAKDYSLNQKIELDNNAEKLSANIKGLPLRLYLSGDFSQFLKYLSALEQLSYYYNIDTLIASNPEATIKNKSLIGEKLDLFIGGKIFWRTDNNNDLN